jgi:hypothetical protein
MTLKRLDAIATGILCLMTSGIVIYATAEPFKEQWNQLRRQQGVVGIVVAQETTKMCRQRKRGALFQCLQWENEQCPVVQYQPTGGQILTRKDCGLTLSNGTQVYVRYDNKVPTAARIYLDAEENYDWVPLLHSGMALGLGGIFLILGLSRFWQGVRRNG